MESVIEDINISIRITIDTSQSWLTDAHRQLFTVVIGVFMCGAVSLFGIMSNIMNLIIFYRQGLNTTNNISLFALAVSDLSSLLLQQWYLLCTIPLFQNSGLPWVYYDVQYITAGIPRESFTRISCLITVYITAQRCLCIAFPLSIKQIFTAKITFLLIMFIYISTWISGIPIYCTSYLDWTFIMHRNMSLLSLIYLSDKENAEKAVYFIHVILSVLSVTAVVIFTLILIKQLGEKSAWRKTATSTQQTKTGVLSNKDRTAVFMVVLIASILIICYTPTVILCLVTFWEPEFSMGGKYFNMFHFLWTFALLLETINSSCNMFVYLRMSTAYRRTFKSMFLGYNDKPHISYNINYGVKDKH